LASEIPTREIRCTADQTSWERFWQDLDRIGLWNWYSDYTDPLVLDGTGWRLEMKHAGREIKTGGDNDYPGADGPAYKHESSFGQFLAALRRLTGVPQII
jgi:hypothetical protein